MKILSYNLYGKKDVESPTPDFNKRLQNLNITINRIIKENDIEVMCFQEVNENNMAMVEDISKKNNYMILDKFPMKTRTINQYNIIAVKKDNPIKINKVTAIPHGKDNEYKNINEQVIDYGMSDYRTTIFVNLEYNNKTYLIGNVHTDYKSSEGIVKGMIKSLNYMDKIKADYKIILGDMNMTPIGEEAKEIIRQNNNYDIIFKDDIIQNSYHGYGINKAVNVDFAFVEKNISKNCSYKIISQKEINDEGSDHRPILLTLEDYD